MSATPISTRSRFFQKQCILQENGYNMGEKYESQTVIKTPENSDTVLEYSGLVNTVQLSLARLLSIPGSFETQSFNELIAPHTPEKQYEMICEVGARFDDALVDFVVCALIATKQQRLVIKTNEPSNDGGHMPWEPKLQDRIELLKETGTFRQATNVEVSHIEA